MRARARKTLPRLSARRLLQSSHQPLHLRSTPLTASRGRQPAFVQACGQLSERLSACGEELSDDGREIRGACAAFALRARALAVVPRSLARRVKCAGAPRTTPRRFAAASAALVRAEIASASCSATIARMPTVRRLAPGKSAATNSTPESRRARRKAAFLDSRSSFATTSVAPWMRHEASARCSSGRSFRRPLSTSTCSATNLQRPPFRNSATAWRCASRPRPLRPCRAVDTR